MKPGDIIEPRHPLPHDPVLPPLVIAGIQGDNFIIEHPGGSRVLWRQDVVRRFWKKVG